MVSGAMPNARRGSAEMMLMPSGSHCSCGSAILTHCPCCVKNQVEGHCSSFSMTWPLSDLWPPAGEAHLESVWERVYFLTHCSFAATVKRHFVNSCGQMVSRWEARLPGAGSLNPSLVFTDSLPQPLIQRDSQGRLQAAPGAEGQSGSWKSRPTPASGRLGVRLQALTLSFILSTYLAAHL